MPSKRYKKLPEKTKDLNAEVIEKLLPEVKKNCTTKFDESLDLSFQINNKQKKSEVNIRTVVNLPGGTGKNVKVAVVCEDNKAQEAKDAGADIVGSDEFVEKISSENSLCLAHLYLKLVEYTLYLDPVYNCTVISFRISAQTLLPPAIMLYRSSVHLNCRTCPLLLLVLVLTNGIPSKMNRVDQSQGSKCVTH